MKLRLLCLLSMLFFAASPVFAEEKEDNVVGIGVAIKVEGFSEKTPEKDVVISKEHPLRVIELTKEGPSIAAGLKVGDQIVKVDDVEVEGKPLRDVVFKIRGKENTRVNISYLRPGDKEVHTLTIERKPLHWDKKPEDTK